MPDQFACFLHCGGLLPLAHEGTAACQPNVAETLVQAREELEAAAAKTKELTAHFQSVTQSLDQKCSVAEQKLSELVVGLRPHCRKAPWLLGQQTQQQSFDTAVWLA